METPPHQPGKPKGRSKYSDRYGKLCLLFVSMIFGLGLWTQAVKADAGPWPTPTPRPTVAAPLPTATFTLLAPTVVLEVQPSPTSTLVVATLPAVIVTPQAATPTRAASRAPSLTSLVCWPMAVALILIVILVSVTLLKRTV